MLPYLTMYFHGARFSNYEAWLSDPTHIKPSAQVVWPIVGQEILNGDVGGGFQGIQITSGFFQLWRGSGITSELQLYSTAIGGLVMAAAMFFAGWFHYHKAAPKLEWFQNVESMLNHHLAGLLGLGSLGWAGHQIHVSLPINKLLDAGVDPKEIPLPHDLMFNRAFMADLYPSFSKGLAPFFTLNWSEYSDFLTFKGGLNPVTGGLWLSDTAHHHVAIAVLFLVAGHMYRTNWGIGHSIKEILEAHRGPFTGAGHVGLYEILTTSWHAQLAINLALFGSLSIIVAHHMYAMPPYPYLATDYATQLSLFTHHMWIGGFCIVGGAAHAAIFMVRDYDPTNNYNNLLDRVIRHRDAIISHLNWVSIFLGFHSFGLYVHNDTMSALGRPQDMFSDTAIQLQPIFAQWIQNTHFLAPQFTAPNALAATSVTWGGDIVAVGGKVAMMPISLGTSDFLVYKMVDQVKLRYMLEQSILLFLFETPFLKGWVFQKDKKKESCKNINLYFIICNFTCSPYLRFQLTLLSLRRTEGKDPFEYQRCSSFPSFLCLFFLPFRRTSLGCFEEASASLHFPLFFPFGEEKGFSEGRGVKDRKKKQRKRQRVLEGFKRMILGIRENLSGRINQQVTKSESEEANNFQSVLLKLKEGEPASSDLGTSETTREASNFFLFDFSDINNSKPAHIKAFDTAFLVWLIGFIEGDGSFGFRDGEGLGFDKKTGRGSFEITQNIDNIKLIYTIRSKLGFGRVIVFKQPDTGKEYCCWYTSRRDHILWLVSFLNGNLVLEKRRSQFEAWLYNINTYWMYTIPLKPCNVQVSLDHAWLAGFSDADGGFYTNVQTDFQRGKKKDGSPYYSCFTKFYITQKGELRTLTTLQTLVGSTNILSQYTNGTSDTKYNRMEICKSESTALLIQYFSRFPLRGSRKIDCLRWARVHAYKQCHVSMTEKAAKKLAKLILSLREPNHGLGFPTLKQLATNFSPEEAEILCSFPQNQLASPSPSPSLTLSSLEGDEGLSLPEKGKGRKKQAKEKPTSPVY